MNGSQRDGWRLDLYRNRLEWRGNQFLVAKSEFYELLAKTNHALSPVHVNVYADLDTCLIYERWLNDAGLISSESFKFFVVHIQKEKYFELALKETQDGEYTLFEEKEVLKTQEYLTDLMTACRRCISENQKGISFVKNEIPDWLECHQKYKIDSIKLIRV
ncbi:hypothetical protein [Alteromonas sp.]|jgi:hypothetical protein|uniref:hypothetical protein n=1 Tax=Alteromonas sp. TaxID=232 RepID=UPI0032D8D6A2